MAVCSTTALRKYLTQRSNLGQPLREKAVSTTRGHAEGETLITSGAYRRPLFKSSLRLSPSGKTVDPEAPLPASPVCDRDSTGRFHGAHSRVIRLLHSSLRPHALPPQDEQVGIAAADAPQACATAWTFSHERRANPSARGPEKPSTFVN